MLTGSDSPGDEMATPYFQIRREKVASTQDVAREELDRLPVLVLSREQTAGRGRSGSDWQTAPSALAASLAMRMEASESRPISLMAGIAAVHAADAVALQAQNVPVATLKWPNDVLIDGSKVGGILVERSGDVVVTGLGLNLWWPEAPEGVTGLFEERPSDDFYAEIGALWGAELMRLVDRHGWPVDEYRTICSTIGAEITWQPSGSGTAVDVDAEGCLVVETAQGRQVLRSGAVTQIRS